MWLLSTITVFLNKIIPYKVEYWQEFYLAKCIEKCFGEINIGDLNEMQ